MTVVMSVSPIAFDQSRGRRNARLVFGQKLLQARFLDRRDVIVDLFDKGRIGVDTNDVIALGRKHGHDWSTELAQPHNGNSHACPPPEITPLSQLHWL